MRAMPQTLPLRAVSSWQDQLADLITDPLELLQLLQLSPADVGYSEAALREFPLRVPRVYAARMRVGDPSDPLLLQVLPATAELAQVPGYSRDPLEEQAATVVPGILHKYQGRVLLILTGACAIHCRYCFRRHFPYGEVGLTPERMRETLKAVAADASIDEVILSGGDPLSLNDRKLASLVSAIEEIGHVRRLRIHTRLPVVIPQRVTRSLVRILERTRLAAWVVLHINHVQEIDAQVERALSRLTRAGIPVLNQAVLLRGVNDSVDALEALCRRLVDIRVAPYYLHQLDRVAGAAHFEVPEEEGRRLIAALLERLPGYAIPRYVREEAGAPSKTPLTSI